MPRQLVFQRLPNSSETQTDGRGFPTSGYTDIDATHPIPCIFTCESGREVIIGGQTKSVTLFSFEIPGLNYLGNATFTRVDFSPKYRVHLLTKGSLAERFLQVIGGGDDIGPSIKFPAVTLEELV